MFKKKHFVKLLATLMCALLSVPFIACSSAPTGPSKDDLAIEVVLSGYGTDWLYSIAREFEKETGRNVYITEQAGNSGVSNMRTSFLSGVSETDIYFTQDSVFNGVYMGKKQFNGVMYDTPYAELSDVYDAWLDNNTIQYKDKMYDSFEEYYNMDGKYYSTSWTAGIMGIIVNDDVWNTVGLTHYPRTTDEMFEMANIIKGKSIAPFLCSFSAEYWTALSPVFIAQYEGSARMKQIYQGYDSENHRYTQYIADFDGYYEMLQLYDKLLKKGNGYISDKAYSLDFTNMQGSFLQGRAAMCPNGEWLEKEMKKNYSNSHISYMKLPIISALANKCSFSGAADKDEKLRTLVDYVDANSTGYAEKPNWATNADIDMVRDARSLEYASGAEHIAFIPAYSNQIELAKQFLIYMASDKAMKIYTEAQGGSLLPFNWTGDAPYDINNLDSTSYSSFRKSVLKISEKTVMLMPGNKDKFFALGGVNWYLRNNKNKSFVSRFSALNSNDYVSADAFYQAEQDWFEDNIRTIKSSAGIK